MASESTIRALAARARAQLPAFSADDLASCRRHRAGTPLSSCIHINNPATGSTSLSYAFRNEPALRNVTFSNGESRARTELFIATRGTTGLNMMHSHAMNVGAYQHWLRRRRLPPASCFVMSLRDPAARLQSAFHASYTHGERLLGTLGPGPKQNRSAALMMDKLRRALAYPEWQLPSGLGEGSGTAYLYAYSAGRPAWLGDWHYPGPINGSVFLTSQLGYLRGLDCDASEVHFVCTETFDDDWRGLLATFGEASSARPSRRNVRLELSSGGPRQARARANDGRLALSLASGVLTSLTSAASAHDSATPSSRMSSTEPPPWPPPSTILSPHRPMRKPTRAEAMAREAAELSVLAAAEADFIRRVLYPWDAELHEHICRRRHG